MPIIEYDIIQGSDEWFKARAGTPGGSSIDKIITPKGEISKSRDDYMRQLAGETLVGHCEDGYKSEYMKNGNDREGSSRALFELIYGVEVKQAGIVWKDQYKLFHFSPDGLPPNAVLEMKNTMIKTHVKRLLDGKLPDEFFGQCQMGLFTCEVDTCYFMNNYEGIKPLIIEVHRDEKYIAAMSKALNDFCAELAEMVKRLRAL